VEDAGGGQDSKILEEDMGRAVHRKDQVKRSQAQWVHKGTIELGVNREAVSKEEESGRWRTWWQVLESTL